VELPSVPVRFVAGYFLVFVLHWLVLEGLESHEGLWAHCVVMEVVVLPVLHVVSFLCLEFGEVVSFCYQALAPRLQPFGMECWGRCAHSVYQ
jgi:hypothetical protein